MKENLLKIRMPMLITNIIIFFTTLVGLFFAIREGSTEKMIVSSIVLILSTMVIIVFLITSNRSATK